VKTAQLRRRRQRRLFDATHQYLGAPIVLVWDNLNTHLSAAMRDLVAGRDWLHVVQLLPCLPDLNSTEGVATSQTGLTMTRSLHSS
jgi:hypothetical protein